MRPGPEDAGCAVSLPPFIEAADRHGTLCATNRVGELVRTVTGQDREGDFTKMGAIVDDDFGPD